MFLVTTASNDCLNKTWSLFLVWMNLASIFAAELHSLAKHYHCLQKSLFRLFRLWKFFQCLVKYTEVWQEVSSFKRTLNINNVIQNQSKWRGESRFQNFLQEISWTPSRWSSPGPQVVTERVAYVSKLLVVKHWPDSICVAGSGSSKVGWTDSADIEWVPGVD